LILAAELDQTKWKEMKILKTIFQHIIFMFCLK